MRYVSSANNALRSGSRVVQNFLMDILHESESHGQLAMSAHNKAEPRSVLDIREQRQRRCVRS